ncbi:indole-3-glycerol phosphate synthase TrpC [Arthrobacter woluwensis]|uniref:indole-3-glycerol phosphate synthase TrpC n=1 Tax=Arthrobacter woluwensis TaxID=156980 RepID=UPI001AAF5587|nr:indole-3-glycerol phosphate synthase TrpC [Arthrobacter woluwensis]QTF71519.1 indole-3-glycerol phosphate synthase TrpC [Arthrobacter woluwensis]
MTVLDDIIAGVREDLEARRLPQAEIEDAARAAAPARDAWGALGGGQPDAGLKVIAEIKRSSPSKGELAGIVDPAALAEQYVSGGASVISVLTEQRRFKGSLGDLDAVRARVDVPLLRKDFTVDEYQIWEARAHGADLILLIAAALDDAQLKDFSDLTHELGMNVLLETHTLDEIERAAAVEARIIGVNVRNLKTLDVDRGVFGGLASAIPAGAIAVAESGVRGVEDAVHYASQGAQALLVGEALVTTEDPRRLLQDFREAGTRAMPARRG